MDFVAVAIPASAGVAVALLCAAVASRRRGPAYGALSTALLGAFCTVGPWRPLPVGAIAPDAGLSMVMANVADNERDHHRAIRARNADLVIVTELDLTTDEGLSLIYPYRVYSDLAFVQLPPRAYRQKSGRTRRRSPCTAGIR
ncbi:MAG: hypothetical protein R2755_28135 [Acidimicrobiales bacterium]